MNDQIFNNIYEVANVNFSCLRLQAHIFSFNSKFFSVLVVNSLCKNIFLIFLANSLCFPCLEKWTSKFPVFPVPWQP